MNTLDVTPSEKFSCLATLPKRCHWDEGRWSNPRVQMAGCGRFTSHASESPRRSFLAPRKDKWGGTASGGCDRPSPELFRTLSN